MAFERLRECQFAFNRDPKPTNGPRPPRMPDSTELALSRRVVFPYGQRQSSVCTSLVRWPVMTNTRRCLWFHTELTEEHEATTTGKNQSEIVSERSSFATSYPFFGPVSICGPTVRNFTALPRRPLPSTPPDSSDLWVQGAERDEHGLLSEKPMMGQAKVGVFVSLRRECTSATWGHNAWLLSR